MIKLLRMLLGLCNHKWETKEHIRLTQDGIDTGTRILCKCEKCGKWEKFDLY